MIIMYARSSSLNTFRWCEQKYYLEYVLGFPTKSGKAATLGSIVHKFLEMLAHFSLAKKDNRAIVNDENLGEIKVNCSFDYLIERCFDFYDNKYPELSLTKGDLKTVTEWSYKAINFNGGKLNPLNQEVVQPELYFDIPVKEEWAKYRYELPNGQILEDYLRLKGTIDLIVTDPKSPDTLHAIDYKTSKAKTDWYSKNQHEKDYGDLWEDIQLRYYHMVLTKLFPQYKYINLEIYFINTGENKKGEHFVFPFSQEDANEAMLRIKNYYFSIKQCNKPNKTISWRCDRICDFGKKSVGEDGMSICEKVSKSIHKVGMEETNKLFMCNNGEHLGSYGAGGGRYDVEK